MWKTKYLTFLIIIILNVSNSTFAIFSGVKEEEVIYPAAPFLARRSGGQGSGGTPEKSSKSDGRGCDCPEIEIVTTNEAVRRKHGELLGKYTKMDKIENGINGLYNGRPGYSHSSGKFFLYYNSASQGFWAVGERLGSEVVRLENQGDRMCPYYLKSLWRYCYSFDY